MHVYPSLGCCLTVHSANHLPWLLQMQRDAKLHPCPTLTRTCLQAFLRVVLQIHGEAVMEHEQLRRRASLIEQHLRKSWNRIEALVEQTRCMVGHLSNQQV